MLKKLLAFFEAVFVVFLVILTITIFTFFVSFSKDNSLPSVFGHSFFVLNTDDMQNENGSGIAKGSLVIASDRELDSLKEGMVVLCDLNDSENGKPDYDVLRIYNIEPGSETTKYTVSNEKMASNRTYIIEKNSIIAKCNYSSELLGQVIAFSRTTQGILILVIIPCIVLIALQIVHMVARARKSKFEQFELESFEFPSDMTFPDDEQSPLYDPKKSDYSQKTDVEEFFNKDYKSASKRKKKSLNEDLKADSGSSSGADKNSSDTSLDVKSDETDVDKKSKKIKNTSADTKSDSNVLQPKKRKSNQSSLSDNISEKTEKTPKTQSADENISAADKDTANAPLEQHEKISENVQIASENALPTADSDGKTNAIAETNEKIQTGVEAKSANLDTKPLEKAADENGAVDKQNAEKPVDTQTDASTTVAPVQRPKKKTTVKKRAVVKKGPSASAVDLLKAIDTESKKLK